MFYVFFVNGRKYDDDSLTCLLLKSKNEPLLGYVAVK